MKTGRILLTTIIVTFIVLLNIVVAQNAHNLPDKRMYLYNQPMDTENTNEIIQKIISGEGTDTILSGSTKVNKSAWIFIPGSLVRSDSARKYVLTGNFDFTDLYQMKDGEWSKVSHGGYYMKFSDESEQVGRYFFKLYNSVDEIADGYLVACRKYDDYRYSQVEGALKSQKELKEWESHFIQSKEWFNRMVLPFFGILVVTTVVLSARFFLSGDRAYLMYAAGNFFFTINTILLYFIDPANIGYLPLDDPMIAVAVTGPVFIMGVGGFILSFRFFYTQKELLELAQTMSVWVASACVLVAVVNTAIVYYAHQLFTANIIMYVFLVGMMITVYIVSFRYRSVANGYSITTSYLTIMYGSFFVAASAVVGFVLSEVYASNSLGLGKFHLQSFPLLVGIAIYNVFVLVAFSSRDHQITEEASQLKIKAYEYEVRVLQNSLNPHFIFNSLNLIDFFVYRKDLPQARSALFQFSDLLRMVIDKTGEKMISLDEELKMLELYLKLESSRNKELFTYRIELDKKLKTENIQIPPLLIQPIVENAVKHGILNKEEEGGEISIIITQSKGFLIIEVNDNGIGFKKSAELKSFIHNDRKHLGMELTKRRLELLSGQSSIVPRDLPEGEGASVVIKFPI